MKNKSMHTGTLETLKRMPSSSNGNPRYRAYVAGFHARTPVDDSMGYRIPNLLGKKVHVVIGMHYGCATIDSIWEAIDA